MAQFQLTVNEIAEVFKQLPVEEQQQLLVRLEGLVNRPQKKEVPETDRYGGIELSEYEGQIEPEQLELLKQFMGGFEASEDFDPTRIYHPFDY